MRPRLQHSGRGFPPSRSPVHPQMGPDLCFAPSGSRHLLVGCKQTKTDLDLRRTRLRNSWRTTGPGDQRPGCSGLSPRRPNTRNPNSPLSFLRHSHAHIPASPFHGVKHSLARRRDFRNRRVTTSGRRRKRLLGSTLRSLGVSEGPPGRRRGPLEVCRQLSGVRVADLRDEERPWPATGPGSNSGSAATARSRAGGCDGEGRVGVRGQRSGGREVLLTCGWSTSLGRGTWTPRRLLGDVRGSGSGGPQWECGIWKVTVALPKSKEKESCPNCLQSLARSLLLNSLAPWGSWKELTRVMPGEFGGVRKLVRERQRLQGRSVSAGCTVV